MRYILDNDGYIEEVSFGGIIACKNNTCTEYIGEIPQMIDDNEKQYADLEEWCSIECSNERLNAWKIVDSNLVYDENKYKKLQELYKIQEEENAPATHKWVKDKLKVSSSVVTDELSSAKYGTSLIVLNDAGNYEIPELKIESASVPNVNVISSNKNILGIDFITSTINGVEIKNNGDGTITLNGTSTDTIEFDLKGSNTNQEMNYLIKDNTNYAISGLTNNVSLSLYSFDGNDRTLVGTYNENINLSSSNVITQTTLNIPSGATFEEVVLKPQIEIGEATSFIKHEETKSSAILDDNECYVYGLMSYEDKTIIMIDEEVTSSVKYYTYQYLNKKFAEIEINENEVKSTVSKMNETIDQQNTSISQISQTVNEIKGEINDIADITIAVDGYGSVSLEKINESEPIYIKIYPTENEDISYLYPRDNLFPSDNLFPKGRTLRFESDEYYIDYELPNDLLYYDENNYDEFVLDYDTQTCVVNKKVAYNEDGTKYLLETTKTISYEYPRIPLITGDYNVTMLGYDNAYMFIRMMCQNLYTNQFATKVELNSSIIQTKDSITSEVKSTYATKNELNTSVSTIKQTTDSINLEVAKKVNNSDYTSAQILMKINNDTSSTVIKSDKVDIEGIATFTNNKLSKAGSTTINGANITTGTIDASKVSVKNLNANNITSGTLSADKVSGGTISSSSISVGSSNYYLRMGAGWTKNPEASGLNVGNKGVVVNGLGFNSNGNYFNFSGGVWSPYLYCDNDATIYGDTVCYGGVKTNNVTPSGNLNLKTGGASGEANGAGILIRTNGGHVSLDASNGGSNTSYGVYARGLGLGNGSVSTSQGQASSKNTKENIVKFEQEDYDDALKLLKDIDLYSYDYKYNLYKNNHQYGFIIDEVEEKENYSKFFDFYESKAKVNGKDLDFAVDDNDEDIISVKQYQPDTLDKYLLTCLKAMQNKIESLENKIKELESDKQ